MKYCAERLGIGILLFAMTCTTAPSARADEPLSAPSASPAGATATDPSAPQAEEPANVPIDLSQPIMGPVSAASSPPVTQNDHPYVRNWLMSGFLAHHFSMDSQENDDSEGVFYEHDFSRNWGLYAGQYSNSGYLQSKTLAADYRPLHAGNFSLGILGGFITKYMQLNHGNLAVAGLPYLTFATQGWKLNVFCVPQVIKSADATCSIQAGIYIGSW